MNTSPVFEQGSTSIAMPEAIAFFCSQACPGEIILKAQAWANAQSRDGPSVIGGFHTPVEREVLRILLRRQAPVMLVLARSIVSWRPPIAIKGAIDAGTLRALSPFAETQRRTTRQSAIQRNLRILTLCRTALFAHASPGGKTEALAREASANGMQLLTLPSTHNSNLMELGATLAEATR